MRLLAHNLLRNTAKDVVEGYPLKIEATKIEVRSSGGNEDEDDEDEDDEDEEEEDEIDEEDVEFIRHLLPTINWKGLKSAATDIGLDSSILPDDVTEAVKEDEEFLKALHKMLFDVHVLEGALICPETGRRFPITDGIVNMMLTNDELS